MSGANHNLVWPQKHAFVPVAFVLLLTLLVGCPSVEQSSAGKSPSAAAKSAAPDTRGGQGSTKPVASPEASCQLEAPATRRGTVTPPATLPKDQAAILGVDGLPDAFTIVYAPSGKDLFEEWRYAGSGRRINFVNGRYVGGFQDAPSPQARPSSLPFLPWEFQAQPTPACAVKLAGPALFLTSAIVLPGWNDNLEVARRWALAKGGWMVTVDARLVSLTVAPAEALPASRWNTPGLYVGTLEGSPRLGGILSRSSDARGYRLSLSPRGQGTTQDGVEVVLSFDASNPSGTYQIDKDARARIVQKDGKEVETRAEGRLSLSATGDQISVQLDGRIDGSEIKVTGSMTSGLWR